MAVRNESVRISAIDDFTSPVARMAAAAALFKRELDDIDGTNVRTSRGLAETARGVDNIGTSSRRSTSDLNQFTGRLAVMGQAVAALGPGLIPIGAVAIPAVTGLASAFGFVATGATTAIVAFQGVGDALDTMRKAQLEPTAANLEAARLAMSQIAPPARDFVRELTSMGPALREVRDAAADGLFSELTPALDDMERALPRVASLFGTVGEAMGKLGADAIGSLTGPEWAEFFSFIEREAPSALADLGSAVGSLAHGFGELWMAFAPLNADFNGWLKDAAEGFDQWAQGLSQTQGFEDFVEYIRTNGPRVADAMGSIANALVQVVQAAAPLGGPVLNAISRLADILASFADSSIGTPILAMVSAMSALTLATKAWNKTSAAVIGTNGALGASFASLAKTASVLLALEGAGRALEFFRDKAAGAAPDVGNLTTALRDGSSVADEFGGSVSDALGIIDQGGWGGFIQDLNAIGESGGAMGRGLMSGLAAMTGLSGQTEASAIQTEKAAQAFSSLDSALSEIAATGGIEAATAAFQRLAESENLTAAEQQKLLEQLPQVGAQISAALEAAGTKASGDALKDFFLGGASAAEEMAGSVTSLSDALAGLSGWLDKREALRGFEDAMKALNQSLDSGKVNEWAGNVDAVGRSLIQVASTLRGPAKSKFIDETIAGLREMAQGAGPKAQAEVGKLINQLKKLDGTKAEPPVGLDDKEFKNKEATVRRRHKALDYLKANPKVDLNDALFQNVFGLTRKDLEWLDRKTSNPKVVVNPSNSLGILGQIKAGLAGIQSKTVTVTTVSRSTQGGPTKAEGGYIRGPGTSTSDSIPAWLSDGEYVIKAAAVDHYGVDILNRLNSMRFADGGLASHTYAKGYANGGSVIDTGRSDFIFPDGVKFEQTFQTGLELAREEMRLRRIEIKERLKEAEKRKEAIKEQVDAAREFRDSLREAAKSLKEGIAEQFSGSDLFGEGATFASIMAGLKDQAAQASEFTQLTLKLKAQGLDGNALQSLLETGNVDLLREFSGLGPDQLALFEQQLGATQSKAQVAGSTAAFARFGQEQAIANAHLQKMVAKADRAEAHAKRLEKQIESLEKLAEKNPRETGKEVGKQINRNAAKAVRRKVA